MSRLTLTERTNLLNSMTPEEREAFRRGEFTMEQFAELRLGMSEQDFAEGKARAERASTPAPAPEPLEAPTSFAGEVGQSFVGGIQKAAADRISVAQSDESTGLVGGAFDLAQSLNLPALIANKLSDDGLREQVRGTVEAVNPMLAQASRAIGPDEQWTRELGAEGRERIRLARGATAEQRNQWFTGEGKLASGEQFLRQLGQDAADPSVAASMIPFAGAPVASIMAYDSAYTRYIEEGNSDEVASRLASAEAGIEGGTSAIPMGKLLQRVPGLRSLFPNAAQRVAGDVATRGVAATGRRVTASGLEEGGQELLAGIGQEEVLRQTGLDLSQQTEERRANLADRLSVENVQDKLYQGLVGAVAGGGIRGAGELSGVGARMEAAENATEAFRQTVLNQQASTADVAARAAAEADAMRARAMRASKFGTQEVGSQRDLFAVDTLTAPVAEATTTTSAPEADPNQMALPLPKPRIRLTPEQVQTQAADTTAQAELTKLDADVKKKQEKTLQKETAKRNATVRKSLAAWVAANPETNFANPAERLAAMKLAKTEIEAANPLPTTQPSVAPATTTDTLVAPNVESDGRAPASKAEVQEILDVELPLESVSKSQVQTKNVDKPSTKEVLKKLYNEDTKESRALARQIITGDVEVVDSASEIPSGAQVSANATGVYFSDIKGTKRTFLIAPNALAKKRLGGTGLHEYTHDLQTMEAKDGVAQNIVDGIGTEGSKELLGNINRSAATGNKLAVEVKTRLDNARKAYESLGLTGERLENAMNKEVVTYLAEQVADSKGSSGSFGSIIRNMQRMVEAKPEKFGDMTFDQVMETLQGKMRSDTMKRLSDVSKDRTKAAAPLARTAKDDTATGLESVIGANAKNWDTLVKDQGILTYYDPVDKKLKAVVSNYNHKLRLKPAMGQVYRLSELLDAPELFAAYPSLKDVVVDMDPTETGGTYFQRQGNMDEKIVVGRDKLTRSEILSTILHEIQHGIQFREGFSQGGAPVNYDKLVAKAAESRDKFIEAFNKVNEGLNITLTELMPQLAQDPEFVKAADSITEGTGQALRKGTLSPAGKTMVAAALVKVSGKDSPYAKLMPTLNAMLRDQATADKSYEDYIKLAGEAEARQVQDDMNMTQEQINESGNPMNRYTNPMTRRNLPTNELISRRTIARGERSADPLFSVPVKNTNKLREAVTNNKRFVFVHGVKAEVLLENNGELVAPSIAIINPATKEPRYGSATIIFGAKLKDKLVKAFPRINAFDEDTYSITKAGTRRNLVDLADPDGPFNLPDRARTEASTMLKELQEGASGKRAASIIRRTQELVNAYQFKSADDVRNLEFGRSGAPSSWDSDWTGGPGRARLARRASSPDDLRGSYDRLGSQPSSSAASFLKYMVNTAKESWFTLLNESLRSGYWEGSDPTYQAIAQAWDSLPDAFANSTNAGDNTVTPQMVLEKLRDEAIAEYATATGDSFANSKKEVDVTLSDLAGPTFNDAMLATAEALTKLFNLSAPYFEAKPLATIDTKNTDSIVILDSTVSEEDANKFRELGYKVFREDPYFTSGVLPYIEGSVEKDGNGNYDVTSGPLFSIDSVTASPSTLGVKLNENRATRILLRAFASAGGFYDTLVEKLENVKGTRAELTAKAEGFARDLDRAIAKEAAIVGTDQYDLAQQIEQQLEVINKLPADQRNPAFNKWADERGDVGKYVRELNKLQRSLSLGLLRQRQEALKRGVELTKEEARVFNVMLANLDTYTTRAYAAFMGDAGKKFADRTISALEADLAREAGKPVGKRRTLTEAIRGKDTKLAKNARVALDYLLTNNILIPPADQLNKLRTDKLTTLYRTWFNHQEGVSVSRQDMIARLQTVTPTPEQAQDKALMALKDLLGLGDKGSAISTYYRGAKLDRGILQARENVPKELRDVMGEITDPSARYLLTISRQADLMAKTKMLLEIAEEGEGNMWTATRGDRFVNELRGKDFGPMEGRFVDQATFDALKGVMEITQQLEESFTAAATSGGMQTLGAVAKTIGTGWVRAVGYSKLSSVVLSPANFAYNGVGSVIMAANNGVFNPKDIKDGLQGAFGVMRAASGLGNTDKGLEILRSYTTDSAAIGEIRTQQMRLIFKKLDEMTQADRTKLMANLNKGFSGVVSAISSGLITIKEAYALMDVWVKAASYYHNKRLFSQINKAGNHNWTPEQIDRKAAYLANQTNVSYSRAIPAAKLLEKTGIIGQFLTYFSEVFRATGANAFVILNMVNEARRVGVTSAEGKLYLGEAARRSIGMSVSTFFSVFVLEMLSAFGDDDEEKEKVRALVEGFSQDQALRYVGVDANGEYVFENMSRLDPIGPLTDVLRAINNAEDGEAMEDGIKALGSLVFQSALSRKVIQSASAAGDARATGRVEENSKLAQIMPGAYTGGANLMGDTWVLTANVADAFLPGWSNALLSETNPPVVGPGEADGVFGQASEYDQLSANALLAAGSRLVRTNPDRAANTAAREFTGIASEYRDRMTNAIRNRNASPEEAFAVALEGIEEEDAALRRLQRVYEGLEVVQGQRGAIATLRENRVPADVIGHLAYNRPFSTQIVTSNYLNTLERNLLNEARGDREKQAEVRQYMRTLRNINRGAN